MSREQLLSWVKQLEEELGAGRASRSAPFSFFP
jgi:hypothetical protein